MKGQTSYVPPPYIPLGQSDLGGESGPPNEDIVVNPNIKNEPTRWSSGICACCDDTQSCILLGLPGCSVACYSCGYRKALRTKYNLQEGPCGDFTTHFFCHLCAICQEYREIRERASNPPDMQLSIVTAPPPVQTMESSSIE